MQNSTASAPEAVVVETPLDPAKLLRSESKRSLSKKPQRSSFAGSRQASTESTAHSERSRALRFQNLKDEGGMVLDVSLQR